VTVLTGRAGSVDALVFHPDGVTPAGKFQGAAVRLWVRRAGSRAGFVGSGGSGGLTELRAAGWIGRMASGTAGPANSEKRFGFIE
jgi:hypothetical protein